MKESNTKQEKTPSHWWLWPLMPIAAVAGAALTSFIIGSQVWLLMKMKGFNEGGWFYLYLMPAFASIAWGVVYAMISYYLAPKGKLVAGSVMVTILSVVVVIGAMMIWVDSARSSDEVIHGAIWATGTIGGAIGGLVHAHSSHDISK